MTEKVFAIGATGNIGSKLIEFLSKKNADITIYTRNIEKAKNLFSQIKNIRFVQGDYSTTGVFEKEIVGHNRLFLLIPVTTQAPDIKASFSKIAYAANVQQIVDISSIAVNFPYRSSVVGDINRRGEDLVLSARGENQFYVAIRPFRFFSNHFLMDAQSIKKNQMLNTIHDLDFKEDFISPTDIAELASVVLTEPVEKHANCVYTMIGETLSTNERAAIFSEVLGKPIKGNNVPIKTMYDTLTGIGISHPIALDLVKSTCTYGPTSYYSVVIDRPAQTLREWLLEDNNISRFQ